MTENARHSAGGHLSYYLEHAIAPVRYRFDDLLTHFDRRDSLYRSLGLPPVAFRAARVLEVAPGTGQNSAYIASCMPQSLDLVEPNPVGLAAINSTYASLTVPHTRPHIHNARLEEFTPASVFDVVLCENWLGGLPEETRLISKLAGLVAPGGVLVLTIVPFSGFFPNVMRKLLSLRIVQPSQDFEERTRLLVEAFGPHLATIANMTRSHRDWVHDCLINPHYLNVALPLESALDAAGSAMESLSTFPRFGADWRWFKALTGNNRCFNANLLRAYRENVHNFLDYRHTWPVRAAEDNIELDRACLALHASAIGWHAAFRAPESGALRDRSAEVERRLEQLCPQLSKIDEELGEAVVELLDVWKASEITIPMVAGMKAFGALFGRETIYLSLTRRSGT